MNFRKLRGASSILLTVVSLCCFASLLAFDNSGQVDIALGIKKNSSLGQSDYSSVEEMRKAEKANEIETQEEGSVLFFNEKNALPLVKTNHVTLLGRTAADNIFKGGSGGSTTTDETATSLYEALKDEGFAINETMYQALKSSTVTRARGAIGEVPGSFYTSDLQASFASDYNDAAIIVLGRYSGEQQDFTAGGDTGKDNDTDTNGDPIDTQGVAMLSLHQEEKDVITMAKTSGKFKKIIVILNTSSAMDIGELKSLGVDSCLWVGYPGFAGFAGVAKVLAGESDISGKTVDTYATNSLSSPAMRNYGSFRFSNVTASGQNQYLVYAEDIYVGYKYYETRYQDQILGINNADSSKGCYAGESQWNYAAEMVYPFGYGLSYSSFKEELTDLSWDTTSHEVKATIKVTNLGVGDSSTYQGTSKDAVALYVSLPYATGQASKSAIQLVGYAKTGALKKGQSETMTLKASDYLFATYDQEAVNGADTTKKGCYTFDSGDYVFSIGNGAHEALNNVLAFKGKGGLSDPEGNAVTGEASKAQKVSLAKLDNTTYAKSPDTGAIVSNHFEDIDVNHFTPNAVTYLSRDDWNTYPSRIKDLTATDEMKTLLDGHSYTKPSDAPEISSFKYSQKYDTPVTLASMKDVSYADDAKWDTFIDQLTPSELAKIPGEKFGNDAITELGVPATSAADGPDGIQANTGYSHVCETVATSTFNDELITKRGKFMAEDGMAAGQNGVYGFGADMHRTPYGGRNFEYYSEDMILSYLAGAVEAKAANDMGLTTYVKHFCANDQEVWRQGSATLMREQAYRQGPLKGFEGSFTKGGSLGTMTSNARVGLRTVSMDYQTMTTVLRNEWGFKGVAMTDSSKGSAYYLYTKESVVAGIDQFNNDETRGTVDMKNALIKEKDGYLWQKARVIAKHYFYMLSHNFCMASLTKDSKVTVSVSWWKTTIIVILSVLAAATVALIVLTVIAGVQKAKKGAQL
jgi:beta-glucosidase